MGEGLHGVARNLTRCNLYRSQYIDLDQLYESATYLQDFMPTYKRDAYTSMFVTLSFTFTKV